MLYTALLDANVLHPMVVCDLLIRSARKDLYRPKWSQRILEETVSSIARRRSDIDEARLRRRIDLMNSACPDAEIKGYEALQESFQCFGSDDHVVAAAVVGRVDLIVTSNLKDFSAEKLRPFNLEAKGPDEFLVDLYWLSPTVMKSILEEQSAGTSRPHLAVTAVLDRLEPTLPNFVKLVRSDA